VQISETFPPNYDEIVKAFPAVSKQWGVLFAWGDTIHNPYAVRIDDPLMAHEMVHNWQQEGKPEEWWGRYLTDEKFRYDQELYAHLAEWEVMRNRGNRHARRGALNMVSAKMASDIYRWTDKAQRDTKYDLSYVRKLVEEYEKDGQRIAGT
jgi:hypothetical protein